MSKQNRAGDNLFCTLLHQLMTAQIQVHDLDLSEIEEGKRETVA
ncbi:MAG: hypothetical protein WA140_06075 [Geobacteraceae bacterium]